MARTADEILSSMVKSINAQDPSIDIQKGPIKDFLLNPVSPEIALQGSAAEHIGQLYSIQFASAASQSEVDALANNFSMLRGAGRTAKYYLYCMRFTKPQPGEIISINSGDLVGTSDSAYVYKIAQDAKMLGDNAASYYNATIGAYEIQVLMEAIAVGTAYNLPAYRINTMVSSIQGIDRVENRDGPYETGLDAETQTQEVDRVQTKFQGLDKGTYGGIESYVRDYSPEAIMSVNVALPKDRDVFYRVVFGPAIDVYPFGTNIKSDIFTYNATGGETELVLPLSPVLSVNYVTINDVAISTYQFDPDASLSYRGSTRATDKVVFDIPLMMNDVVVVGYTRDKLVYDIQSDLFSSSTLFNTDVLVRRPTSKLVVVELVFKPLPSAVESRVQTDIETALSNIISPGTWVELLEPEIVRVNLEQQVSGVSGITLNVFRASDSTVSIEAITFGINQRSDLDLSSLKITSAG